MAFTVSSVVGRCADGLGTNNSRGDAPPSLVNTSQHPPASRQRLYSSLLLIRAEHTGMSLDKNLYTLWIVPSEQSPGDVDCVDPPSSEVIYRKRKRDVLNGPEYFWSLYDPM